MEKIMVAGGKTFLRIICFTRGRLATRSILAAELDDLLSESPYDMSLKIEAAQPAFLISAHVMGVADEE